MGPDRGGGEGAARSVRTKAVRHDRRGAPDVEPPDPLAAPAASTRDRLIHTALRLFYEQGYHATGVATILREAGVNSGSLYHFFDSKEHLLEGVLSWYIDNLRPVVLAPAEAAAADPIGRVFALMAWYRAGVVATGCAGGCPIGNLALELGDSLPRARRLIDQNFENWARGVEAWLVAAGDRLPAETDRHQLSRFVLTTMEGGIMQARAAGRIEPFDASVEQLRAYFDAMESLARARRAG